MKVATQVLVRTERHAGQTDQAIAPFGRHVGRAAQLTPVVREAFNVRDLVGAVRLEEPLEPRGPGRRVRRSLGDDGHELGDRAVHRSSDGARGAVDVLERGR